MTEKLPERIRIVTREPNAVRDGYWIDVGHAPASTTHIRSDRHTKALALMEEQDATIAKLLGALGRAADLAHLGNDDVWAIAALRDAGAALAKARGEETS